MELNLHENSPREPRWEVQFEKPEHRTILYLRAKCYTVKQIAKAVGYTPQAIYNLTKQPWFRRRLVELMHELGGEQVEQFLRLEAPDALDKIVELMHECNDPRVQLQAAFKIVDKVVPDKIDVQRHQQLPPAQLNERIKVLQEQIKEIEGEPADSGDTGEEPVEEAPVAQSESNILLQAPA